MKKVFSLVLALAMVLGMSTMAFAAPTGVIDALDFDVSATETVALGKSFVVETAVDPWDATTNVAGKLEVDSSTDLVIKNLISSVSSNLKKVTLGGTDYGVLTTTVTIKGNISTGTYTGDLVLVDKDGDLVTIDLAITVTTGTTGTTGTIPAGAKITAVASNWTDYLDWSLGDAVDLSDNKTYNEDLNTRSKLVAGMFVWDSGYDPVADGTANVEVRSSHIKDVGVRKTNPVNNSGTIRDVGFDGTKLRIRTIQYFLKCGKTDVSFDLDLTFKSKASGTTYPVNFTIENEQTWMYDGQDYIETTDPIYVQADVSLRNVEMYLGENLYITKSFGKDQKAYAHVSLELSAGDEKLFMQYPELSDVYTLYTVGVNSANVYAEFKDLGDTYFVYNEAYKLIGTTADKKLPFANKYYLTTKKVDLAGTAATEEEPASSTTPGDTGAVDTGGAATAPSTNYNPNTGR